MKSILLFGLLLFFSCNAGKKTASTLEKKAQAVQTQCPENGKCSWELMKGKSLVIKKDGTGALYPQMIDNPETSVIKFRYHRDSPEGIADAQYTEEVYFEVQNDVKELMLQGEELQKAKLLFGRMCFCERGTVGYFKVEEGTLNYSKDKGVAKISLVFQNGQVPQVLGEIDGRVDFHVQAN